MEAKYAPNWSSLDATSEEAEMIAHLQSMFWSNNDVDLNLCSTNNYSRVTTSTMPSSLFLSLLNHESYHTMPLVDTSLEFDLQVDTCNSSNGAVCGDRQREVPYKRKLQMDEQKNPNKKVRTAPSAPRRDRNLSVLDNETNAEFVSQSCCSCSSEEDSNGSSEKSAVLIQSEKSRAHRRSSSKDSQSLYAKKRRERINERLRTLQKLVPNGTKVDISTMLEEAVQYVKFLQLQIKLLSSDETWMYAPLAYNGVNIGLDLNTSPT